MKKSHAVGITPGHNSCVAWHKRSAKTVLMISVDIYPLLLILNTKVGRGRYYDFCLYIFLFKRKELI